MSGYEPPQIPGGGEHTDSWDHPEIKQAFTPLDTTTAIAQAERYWQVHQIWEQGVETFARSIQKSIDQAWSGPAADKSKDSIQNYTKDAQTLTPALAELHTRVRDAATAIANTKKAIPDTVDTSFGSRVFHPSRWDLSREKSEETQKARVAMNEHYVQPFSQIDGKIPVLPTPTSPTKAVDITPPPGGYKDENSNNGGPPNQPKSTDTEKNSNNPTVTNDKDGDGKPDESTTDEKSTDKTKSDQTTPASTTDTTPASTTPATTTPGAPTTDPTKTVPSSTTPSTPGTPHSPGSPGSPGSPNSKTPQPGRSIPGTPATPGTTTSNPAAAAAAARGASGTPGMGGMGAGARGGKSEDDSEHKIPDYLITQENTDELLGELPKTIPGGVIGGDIPT